MTRVRLHKNKEIGDEGAKALAEALKVNTTVESLRLNGCGIGDDGAAALAKVVRSLGSNTPLTSNCHFLTSLDLMNNGIGKQAKQLLRSAVAARQEATGRPTSLSV